MKNKPILYILIIAMLLMFLSCQRATSGEESTQLNNSAAPSSTNNTPVISTSSPETTDMSTHSPKPADYTDIPNLTFADLADKTFDLSIGAGGWSTTLKISEDGSFTGYYFESDLGDIGDDYPNGTVYYCSFSGKFSDLKKTGDFEYTLKCDMLTQEGKVGEVEIGEEDGVRYINSPPYGMENAKELKLYLPGKNISELPEEFLEWVEYSYLKDFDKLEILPCWGLYNEEDKLGFINK